MTEKSQAQTLRDFIRLHGPVKIPEIAKGVGISYDKCWNTMRAMAQRGILAKNEDGAFVFVREAIQRGEGLRKDPAAYCAREKERLRNRDRRRAEIAKRGLVGPVVRAKREAERAGIIERVDAAKAIRNRENGVKAVMPAPVKAMTSWEWEAMGGKVQRLASCWDARQ